MISPSEFKSLITFKSYASVKDNVYGGITRTLAETVQQWCKFERLSGSTGPNQSQMMSDVQARITTRFNSGFTTNWVVEFEGQEYTIKFIKTEDPAYKRFMIIDCAVSISQTSWS